MACQAQADGDWPSDPPPQSSCSDSVVRHYVDGKPFDGLKFMTRLAHRRYPESRVRMGAGGLVHAQMFKGACFASVPFYFDHPDRFELWASMLVDSTHKARFISVWAADYLPFETWRSTVQSDN